MHQERKNSHIFCSNRIKSISFLVIFMLFLNTLTSAQVVKISYADSTKIIQDSLKNKDTSLNNLNIPISSDKLESEVKYQAKDSLVYDAINKKLMLYTNAEISFEDIKVTADYIEYLQDSSLLTALEIVTTTVDTSKVKPRINQGQESSTFSALYFNFNR